MSDLDKEKKEGFSLWYLKDVLLKRKFLGEKQQTPGFAIGAQLFATMSKFIIEKLGPEEGESLIKEAVEYFGNERGKRIAEVVKNKGKPLSFKNWLIYTDIHSSNFPNSPRVKNNNLVAEVGECTFNNAARKWGLEDYSKIYCKYADYAILNGYNPDVLLELEQRHVKVDCDSCTFCYIMKEQNQKK